jgi:hypothetical protein
VNGGGDVHAGLNAQCDVVVAGGILMKHTIAHGFVVPACRIAGERRRANGLVAVITGIAKK